MARVFMTGMETGNLGVFSYVSGATCVTSPVRTGSYSLCTDSEREYVYADIPSVTEIYERFAVYPTGWSGNPAQLHQIFNSGSPQLTLTLVQSTLSPIQLRKGAYDGTVIASGGELRLNTWSCLEVYAKIHSTEGRAIIKCDGQTIIDYTGNTAQSGNNIDRVRWGDVSSGYHILYAKYDDIAVNDTSGAVNNSWIGRGGIFGLRPSGAGTHTEFTPSAGNNYECVDEVPPNDDTDYVESDTVGKKDTYALGDLSVTTGNVAAVQWIARAKLNASGTGNFKRLLRHGGTDYSGTDQAVDVSYKYFTEILNKAPDDTEWDIDKVNALEAGMEVS